MSGWNKWKPTLNIVCCLSMKIKYVFALIKNSQSTSFSYPYDNSQLFQSLKTFHPRIFVGYIFRFTIPISSQPSIFKFTLSIFTSKSFPTPKNSQWFGFITFSHPSIWKSSPNFWKYTIAQHVARQFTSILEPSTTRNKLGTSIMHQIY